MKQLQDFTNLLESFVSFLKRYTLLVVFLCFSAVYGFLAYRINTLTQAEPTDEAVAERLKTVGRTKVDKDAVAKMRQLEEENIEIQALFDSARKNPFTED